MSNAVNVTTQHIAGTGDPRRSSGWRLVRYLFRNPLWLSGWVALADERFKPDAAALAIAAIAFAVMCAVVIR